jgi:hypothetical protein
MADANPEPWCNTCRSSKWCGRPCGSVHKFAKPDPARDMVLKAARRRSAKAPAAVANVSHMANVVANISKPGVANAYPPTYRYRDPEKRRTYMRDYMRRRRQKKDTP